MAKLVVWVEVKDKSNGKTFRRDLYRAAELLRVDFADLFVAIQRNAAYETDEYAVRFISQGHTP